MINLQYVYGGSVVIYDICKIDLALYSVVASNIVTDEVIITSERIEHIRSRHRGDFEEYGAYFAEILQSPDYILENRRNTAEVLKEILHNGKKCKLILRLQTSSDPKGFKNAIITFLHIRDSEWRRLLRSKKVLYKRK